jgi:hypothetical protein
MSAEPISPVSLDTHFGYMCFSSFVFCYTPSLLSFPLSNNKQCAEFAQRTLTDLLRSILADSSTASAASQSAAAAPVAPVAAAKDPKAKVCRQHAHRFILADGSMF